MLLYMVLKVSTQLFMNRFAQYYRAMQTIYLNKNQSCRDISYEKVDNLIFRCANISCFQVVSESVFDLDFRFEIVPVLKYNHN